MNKSLLQEKKAAIVKRWLDAMAGFPERSAALERFPYVGRWGAYYVLSVAAYEVPEYETWQASA